MNPSQNNDEPRRRAARYRRSARYGFYADLIPLVSKFLASLEPPQSGGVLNPLANKKDIAVKEMTGLLGIRRT